MRLYLVDHEDDDGDNFDLLVVANTPDEAVQLWWKYYDMTDSPLELPGRVFDVMEMPKQEAHALPWYGGDIKCIEEFPVAQALLALSLT